MSNETIIVNDTEFRVLPQGDDHEKDPWFKCACSTIIKQEKNLHKHTLTKSHEQNLINKHYFAPPKESLLRPGLKFPEGVIINREQKLTTQSPV
jgi:hypothetical protein